MATKSVITKIRRKKMAEASHTTGKIAKITHIALGSGGVDANRKVIEPLPENVRLKHEVIRKPYTSSTKVSETSYEYVIKLEENELIGVEISEMALIDEDGDVAAFSNFLAKGKDETEVTFTIEDNYYSAQRWKQWRELLRDTILNGTRDINSFLIMTST